MKETDRESKYGDVRFGKEFEGVGSVRDGDEKVAGI